MKIIRKLRTLGILGLIGTITFFLIGGTNKGIDITAACTEVAIYQSHHKPVAGWYYSVEEVSVEVNKTFVIGHNVRPMIGGTVAENGKMVEIEVPTKRAGALKGAYLIVRDVDGVPTTVYFLDERQLVLDALQN